MPGNNIVTPQDGDAYVFDVSLFNPGSGSGPVTRPSIELTNLRAPFAPTNGRNGNGTAHEDQRQSRS